MRRNRRRRRPRRQPSSMSIAGLVLAVVFAPVGLLVSLLALADRPSDSIARAGVLVGAVLTAPLLFLLTL